MCPREKDTHQSLKNIPYFRFVLDSKQTKNEFRLYVSDHLPVFWEVSGFAGDQGRWVSGVLAQTEQVTLELQSTCEVGRSPGSLAVLHVRAARGRSAGHS